MQFAEIAFGLECLEQRTHLTAAPLVEYWPLVPGATWMYDTQGGGAGLRSWEKETILPRQKITYGVKAFQRLGQSSDGDVNVSLETLSAGGLFGLLKRDQVAFQSPILFPQLAAAGERLRTQGQADARVLDWFIVNNDFRANVRVLGNESVKVPAGTFSTVKVRMTATVIVHRHMPKFVDPPNQATDVNGTIKITETEWLAQGVGAVKTISKRHLNMKVNNNRRVKGELVPINIKRVVQDEVITKTLHSYSIPSGNSPA